MSYFAASVDTPDVNARFAASLGIGYPILSDPTKATATAYGVLGGSGFANRWTFYIGKDGNIAAVDKTIKVATSAEDMAAKLGELGVEPAKK